MRQNEGRTTKHTHTPSTTAGQLSRHSCNQIPRGRYQRETGPGRHTGRTEGEGEVTTGRGTNKSQKPSQKKRDPPTPTKEHNRNSRKQETHRRKQQTENRRTQRAKPQRGRKTTKGTEGGRNNVDLDRVRKGHAGRGGAIRKIPTGAKGPHPTSQGGKRETGKRRREQK